MSKEKVKPIRPETGFAAVSPWTSRPWLHSVRNRRCEVVEMLNKRFGRNLEARQWRAEGWRFVRVTVRVSQ